MEELSNSRKSVDAISDHVLEWVKKSVDEAASVRSVRRLHGGTSSIMHSMELEVDEAVRGYVLRQFDNVAWLTAEPDLARHEAENLGWALRTGLPTPILVAFDETGSNCGMPAVLMTKLEGTVVLQPSVLQHWINSLAETLVRIHEVNADDYPWTYFSYNNAAILTAPSWSNLRDSWNRAIRYVREKRPRFKPCFIHRDYHPANVLWSGDTVSGVVDWVNACRGPAGIDVGHCRVNLALLNGVATADEFLSAYVSYAGHTFRYDPYWDLVSLADMLFVMPAVNPGWIALGVSHLTDQMMAERMDTYMLSLLERAQI